jgi:RNA polymerase sigma-70 factor, ECF subfamily
MMEAVATEGIIIRDKAEFESLFRAHYSTLCGYANTFLRDRDASEEIVQEVMLKIWVNRSTILINTSVRSYLFRAVRNGCMNLIKHLEVREEYKAWNETQGENTVLSQEDRMVASELEEKIREAIERLPLERRKVFVMSRYDNLTYAEIAAKLGISVKTVENQMGKALKTLREELAEYLPWLVLFFFDVFRGQG